MMATASSAELEETLLKHKNDVLDILKAVHDVINNAVSLDSSLTPLGMNLMKIFISLLQSANVSSKSELDSLWKSCYNKDSVREVVDDWLDAEDDWNNSLRDIDSKCSIKSTSETKLEVSGSLIGDTELIEVKSGLSKNLKDYALSKNLSKLIVVFIRHFG